MPSDTDTDRNGVFTPKRTLNRSGDSNVTKKDKRKHGMSSGSESEGTSQTDGDSRNKRHKKYSSPKSRTDVTNIIAALHKSSKDIVTATTRVSADKKLSFNKAEQKTVHNSLTDINNNVQFLLGLLYSQETRITKLQEQILEDKSIQTQAPNEEAFTAISKELLNKIENLQKIPTAAPTNPQTTIETAQTSRTYAQLTQQPARIREPPKEWQTPIREKKVETYDTVVKLNEGIKSDPITELKKVLKAKDLEGHLVRRTQTAVVISSKTKEDQTSIKEKIVKNTTITVKDGSRNIAPMALITGVQKGFNEEDLFKAANQENELDTLFGEGWESQMKRVGGRNCRNPYKETIIITGPAEIIKALLKRGFLYLDLTKCYIEEYVSITICFKCCRFGHSAARCQDTSDTCYKCAARHSGTSCSTATYNCVNCQRLGLQLRNHEARDTNCPIYKRKLEDIRNSIVY